MADFPLDPQLSAMLLRAPSLGCTPEILTIVAMLSVPTCFLRPKQNQKEADDAKAQFAHIDGDHLTLLNLYNTYQTMQSVRSFFPIFSRLELIFLSGAGIIM
jgi:pre-mRNA-splicing factor ATP-dependent RNA helicase DHX15/PRP43